jgi:predicted DNA binding CopG/RHH family protein
MKVARSWVDPFDQMSDEEFDAHVDEMFAAPPATVAVSLRMAPDLLGRLKREAARAGVPYQTFMKGILEAGLSRLERRGPRPGRSARTTPRKARRRAV